MKRLQKKLFQAIVGLLIIISGCKTPAPDNFAAKIIPEPVKIEYTGKMLKINKGVNVIAEDPTLDFARGYLLTRMKSLSKPDILKENKRSSVKVTLRLDEGIEKQDGYVLTIGKKITIAGQNKNGVLYGIQSLLQILQQAPENAETLEIPRLVITDYPRFGYRGMHLDVSRHFFPVDFVKKYIDLIAMHKMNTFHWHLTDDQGWRLEIKKYPRLTEVGAWRVDHEDMPWNLRPDQQEGDTATYGGSYTHDQVREIVAYAADRGINVIPEIEMPGHSAATIAAYPEYSCRGNQHTVPSGGAVDVSILCAGKDETFTFLQNILTEVMELFPSKYIHIGGDEAWKREWENCPLCQKRIEDEGLADEHELQSYFIRNIDRFLTSKGRILVGWDEILEGGLAPNATVMSWRGEAGGIKSAQMGHDVIMTPVGYCYFDYYQNVDKELEPLAFNGYISLSKVYNYEPVPAELKAGEAKFILGAQGNVWTEYIPDGALAECRVLPRMTALSEVLWSPAEKRDEAYFIARLEPFLDWLAAEDYQFNIPTPAGIFNEMVFLDSLKVEPVSPWPFAQIRYTLDGSEPNDRSALYEKPFTITNNTVLKTGLFLRNGRRGKIKTAALNRVEPITAYAVNSDELQQGLYYNYYEVAVNSVGAIKKHIPKSSGIMANVELPAEHRKEVFAANFKGYFYAPETGIYTFALTSDDGSSFYLGENLEIDNDGFHGQTTVYGQIALQKGYYPIYVGYFDGGGGNYLKLQLVSGNGALENIPEDRLYSINNE